MLERDRLPAPVTYFVGEGLTLHGRGKWRTTSCVFHGGSDSMRVNIESGGWCCMACFEKGGDVLAYQMKAHEQDFVRACKALGAWIDGSSSQSRRRRPPGLSCRDQVGVLRDETLLVALIGADVHKRREISDRDHAALFEAVRRIQNVVQGNAT
jgi:CHC2-type zinc finger protein